MNTAYHQTSTAFSYSHTFLKDMASIANIVAIEAYAVLTYTLPASLSWVWQHYISREIKTFPIQVRLEKVSKTAYLHLHGDIAIKQKENSYPVLMSHGDYGHPYSTLHLADIAKKKGHPTFSLHIPGVEIDDQFDLQSEIFNQTINKIESLIQSKGGDFTGLLGVGHSKGAILLAHRQFVHLDSRLKATCAIAGRLNVFEDSECPNVILKERIQATYTSALKHPKLPLMQIIPKDDWNAPYDAMAIRPEQDCHTVPGMHLSGLYSHETHLHFTAFLKKFKSE